MTKSLVTTRNPETKGWKKPGENQTRKTRRRKTRRRKTRRRKGLVKESPVKANLVRASLAKENPAKTNKVSSSRNSNRLNPVKNLLRMLPRLRKPLKKSLEVVNRRTLNVSRKKHLRIWKKRFRILKKRNVESSLFHQRLLK